MLNTRNFSILLFLMLLVPTLSACDRSPRPLVPLPTYGTRPPLLATKMAGTTLPRNTPAPSPTVDPNFWTDGTLVQGWWWIRDTAYKNTANWIVDIPAGTEDITLNLTVLATFQVSGGRGASAVFFLSYGQPASATMGGKVYGRSIVELPNTSPVSDPVGYTCTGTLRLTRAEIKNASHLWLQASRKDDMGEFPPSKVHVAFNKPSIMVGE